MIRRILPFFLLALFFLLDITILPVLASHWLIPVFSLVLVHCLGLLEGRSRGTLDGLVLGLLIDITAGTPLGLMTALYAGMGYVGGWVGRTMWRNKLAPLFSAAFCFAVYELVMDVYVTFMAAQFDSMLFLRSLIRLPIYIALVLGGYYGLGRLMGSKRSHYARR